jgi:hypothetical protein
VVRDYLLLFGLQDSGLLLAHRDVCCPRLPVIAFAEILAASACVPMVLRRASEFGVVLCFLGPKIVWTGLSHFDVSQGALG